jgi:hypothetical protein
MLTACCVTANEQWSTWHAVVAGSVASHWIQARTPPRVDARDPAEIEAELDGGGRDRRAREVLGQRAGERGAHDVAGDLEVDVHRTVLATKRLKDFSRLA